MSERNDGGPAFPVEIDGDGDGKQTGPASAMATGMRLRDYLAANLSDDDHLTRMVRTLDDYDLARFALRTDDEEVVGDAADYMGLGELEKIEKRMDLEAKAIARARYKQADAMLAERENNHE